jgi:hypothetical protein
MMLNSFPNSRMRKQVTEPGSLCNTKNIQQDSPSKTASGVSFFL